MPIVDLSHTLEHGTRTYPGFPPMSISDFWDHDNEGWQISQVTFVSSSGTYLDAPLHRYSDGQSVAELSLDSCANLPGVKIVTSESKIEDSVVSIPPERLSGRAVLIQTDWSRNWGTSRYRDQGDHPGLGQAAVDHLIAAGVALVGIDSLNIDYLATEEDDVFGHDGFLREGIPIVEQLTNLSALPMDGFRFFAAPLPFQRTGSCPVRAFAITSEA